jgi:hypothetical protein
LNPAEMPDKNFEETMERKGSIPITEGVVKGHFLPLAFPRRWRCLAVVGPAAGARAHYAAVPNQGCFSTQCRRK